jgi:hypothetical protein
MDNWDLTAVGLVLIVSSITVAGTIIGAMLLGFSVALAPYFLIISIVLIVMGAISIFYDNTAINAGK